MRQEERKKLRTRPQLQSAGATTGDSVTAQSSRPSQGWKGVARHSVRATESNPFPDRRARSDAPYLTYIEITAVLELLDAIVTLRCSAYGVGCGSGASGRIEVAKRVPVCLRQVVFVFKPVGLSDLRSPVQRDDAVAGHGDARETKLNGVVHNDVESLRVAERGGTIILHAHRHRIGAGALRLGWRPGERAVGRIDIRAAGRPGIEGVRQRVG